jgi:hypothetical protein
MSSKEDTAALISYLDEKLPWSITIRFINFLSWFQLVKPVDERISQLRQCVNATLEEDRSKASIDSLLRAYKEYFSFLKEYFTNDAHMPNDPSTKARQPNDKSKELFKDGQITLIDIATKEIAEQREAHHQADYRNMTKICQTNNWQTALPNFFKTLDAESQLYCTKKILYEAENARHYDWLQNASLLAVQLLNYESSDRISILFNNLDNDVDIKKYLNYLNNCDNELRLTLSSRVNSLQQKTKAMRAGMGFDIQKKHASLDHAITKYTNNEQSAWEQPHSQLDTLRESFRASYNETVFTDQAIKDLIQHILACFDGLKQLVELYTSQPCLSEYENKEKNSHKKENKQIEERLTLHDKLMSGEITSISSQRLKELSSTDGQLWDLLKKCKALGVTVFDATDEKQVQHAIATHVRLNL